MFMKKEELLRGIKNGIPIGLSYFSVSFAFGIMASSGLSPLVSTFISFTNLTSSGQYAGVKLILAYASYFEIFLAVLLINLRYLLMSFSLSQKLDPNISLIKRMILSYGVTDEIYALAIKEKKEVTFDYFLGLMIAPVVCWTLGTLSGSLLSNIFSERLLSALGILLYSMFISIIMPDAKRNKNVLIIILISIALSCILEYIPIFNSLGMGFRLIISAVISSTIGALIFPIKEEREELTNE